MNTPAEPVRANSVAKGLITLAIKTVRTPVEGQCSCSVIPLSVQLYGIIVKIVCERIGNPNC